MPNRVLAAQVPGVDLLQVSQHLATGVADAALHVFAHFAQRSAFGVQAVEGDVTHRRAGRGAARCHLQGSDKRFVCDISLSQQPGERAHLEFGMHRNHTALGASANHDVASRLAHLVEAEPLQGLSASAPETRGSLGMRRQ